MRPLLQTDRSLHFAARFIKVTAPVRCLHVLARAGLALGKVTQCHLKISASRPNSCVRSSKWATRSPPPSRRAASPRCSKAATCSPLPRRAPARRPPSRCRCCRSCTKTSRTARLACAARPRAVADARTGRADRSSPSPISAPTGQQSALIFGGVSQARRSTCCAAAWTSSWPRQGGCSITPTSATSTCAACDPGAGRSRPHARHGLHPRHPPDARAAAAQRQTLLFSATFSEDIRGLANGLLRNPLTVEVAPRNAPTELVDHRVHLVSQGEKRAVLATC